jgi:hypothetical protein
LREKSVEVGLFRVSVIDEGNDFTDVEECEVSLVLLSGWRKPGECTDDIGDEARRKVLIGDGRGRCTIRNGK